MADIIKATPKGFITYHDEKTTATPKGFVTYHDEKTTATPKGFVTYHDEKTTATPIVFLTYDMAAEEEISFGADTERRIETKAGFTADTKREIEKGILLQADTKRSVFKEPAIGIAFTADTKRDIEKNTVFFTDTSRNTEEKCTMFFDTKRSIEKSTSFSADTQRKIQAGAEFDFSFLSDTRRGITKSIQYSTDTVRKIPHVITEMENKGISAIHITLAEKTLSDTLRLETTGQIDVCDALKGKVLDFEFNFIVEETSQSGIKKTASGMYDIDTLLYTPFTYHPNGANTAKRHAESIASGLGKKAVILFDNFVPSADFSGSGATYKNIISSLFGWTSELPQRQINVFLRKGKLYFVQRGKEQGRVDLTNTKHSKPTIDRKILRSVWSGTGEGGDCVARSTNVAPIPFSGTIQFADQASTYAAGLLIAETHGEETTKYFYVSDYLQRKETKTKDSAITTVYEYATTKKDKFLAKETETTIDQDGNKTERVTRHVAIGHGWYGTTVEEDGEYSGSSISQGRSGGKASKYCIDSSNLSLGSGYSDIGDDEKINGTALMNTSFPVEDTKTLKELTKAIEWLNRKIEERMTMEIYQMQQAIDFTQKILFNGNTYFLEKNTIEQTSRLTKQSISIVRWY